MNDQEPTQEQKKEFWERCGFKGRYEVDTGIWFCVDPTGLCSNNYPPIDPNSLFKYAMQKLDQAKYYKVLSSIFFKQKDPALSLFWAIKYLEMAEHGDYSKMNDQEYGLNCDKCGEVFRSKEAFPDPQLCLKCNQAKPIKYGDKEVDGEMITDQDRQEVEKCLLTNEEINEAYMGSDYHPDFKISMEVKHGVERVAQAAAAKSLNIAEPLIRRECDEEWIREIEEELVESDSRNMFYLNKKFWLARKKEKGIE